MNTKRQAAKKSPIVTLLVLVIAGLVFAYSQGHLDRFLPAQEKTETALVASTEPERHIEAAQAVLEELPRQERCSHYEDAYDAPCQVPPYDREAQFGSAWVDVDQDGCSTREQVLARDLENVTQESDCYVSSGELTDPYTGQTLTDRSQIDIDHLIPLALAWDLGANEWTQGERVAFANDPEINLLAVDGKTNQQDKKDLTLAEWEPSTDYTCTYAIKYVWALHSYDLPITPDDYTAADRILGSCDVVYGEPTDAEPLDPEVQAYAERF